MSVPSGSSVAPAPPSSAAARRSYRLAWVSVAALPVTFVGAMVLGEWLFTLQGYDVNDAQVPLSAVLSAAVPAMLVMILPAITAIWFGLRAERLGLKKGRLAATIGIFFIAVTAFQSILGLVGKMLTG